jgi:methionyl-tRNA formyltransferase
LLKVLRAGVVENDPGRPGEILSAGRDGIVVSCGEGSLRILELQREGGKRLNAQQFLAGFAVKPGDRLG